MNLRVVCALLCVVCLPVRAEESISHGRFEHVRLFRPAGEPRQVVLLLSSEDGWDERATDMARVLVERDAMVAGIDTPAFFAKLRTDGGRCTYPDGDLENLSHYLQGYARLSTYHTPLLVGESTAASFAYAVQSQAPSGTFAGVLTLGFCPGLDLDKTLCAGDGLKFRRRQRRAGVDLLPAASDIGWTELHGANDTYCAAPRVQAFVGQVPGARFVPVPKADHRYEADNMWPQQLATAYEQLAATNNVAVPAPPADLAGLPLIEVPAAATGNADTANVFAVILSGDGGWAGLDKRVAAALAAKGVAVVGLDSLRYFWSKRTPEGLATDLDRVLRYYSAHWKRHHALLVGYSQGANVLPASFNRLPTASRGMVVQLVLLGLEHKAAWEFHVGNWIGATSDAVPIQPEASKLRATTTLCLYGSGDKDALCPELPAESVTAQQMPGGHHFNGAYDKLADMILDRLN